MTKKTDIVKIDHKEYGLESTKAKEIESVFLPMLAKMTELETEYNDLIKLDMSFDTSTKAKELRLKYVKIRTETAEIHKKVKAFYLNGGRFVDGWKNAQLFASQDIEETLQGIEKHFERKEQERKDKLGEERLKLLETYEIDTEHLDLGEMADDLWKNYFAGVVATDEKEKKEAAALEAKEKAEQEAQAQKVARMQTLSGMGMVWIDALDHYEKLGQTVSKEAVLKLDNEEFEMVITATAVKLEKAKKEAEKLVQLATEKLAKEAKVQAEKDKKKAVADAKIQAEKDIKTKATEAKRAEDLKKAEVQRQADLAPDKEKLQALAKAINEFQIPKMKSVNAKQLAYEVDSLLIKVVTHINSKLKEL